MWSLFLIILMVSAEHEVYIDSHRSQTTVMINGNEYVSKPERIYHPIEIRDGVEMGYGNFEGPEVSEFRVHGDAYIDETLYVGANVTLSIWNETCCAPLYDTNGAAWTNSGGQHYTESTCPSCNATMCKGCRQEILLANYIEETVRKMNLLYKVLFSATYEEVTAQDYELSDGTELSTEPVLMKLNIKRDVEFHGIVDIIQEN